MPKDRDSIRTAAPAGRGGRPIDAAAAASDAPAVSVVMAVHDEEPTLDEACAAIAAQTWRAWEAVLVLNGCRDGSAAIAARWRRQDGRFRVITRPDADLVGALRVGLDAARAPLIARFDADDLMDPERLAAQVEALKAHPDWDVCATDVRYGRVPGADVGRGLARYVAWLNRLRTHEDMAFARFVDAPVCHPSVVMRASAVAAVGGYRERWPEDHDLWLRLFAAGARFGKVARPLVTWRDRPDRMTRADPRLSNARRWETALLHLLAGPLAGGRACRVWGAGRYGRRYARDLARAGVPVDDVIDVDPRKVGRRVAHGVPVVDAAGVGPPDGRLVLLAVAQAGAREAVVARLEALGYRRERDMLPLR